MVKYNLDQPKKLRAGVKYSCEALDSIDPSQEGFWRRLKYEFTSDFKCAANLDSFISALKSMNPESSKSFENISLDYAAVPKANIIKLLSFATTVVARAKVWIEKCKPDGWVDAKRNEARAYLVKETEKLDKEFDLDTILNLNAGKTPDGTKYPSGKSVKDLGFSKADVVKLAQDFKSKASGDLKIVKQIRGRSQALTNDYHGNMTTVHLYMYEVSAKLDMAVDAYKKIDYFLYYLSKEI